jgi:hypothetical protein
MLTQAINLLASARPNLGAAGQGWRTPAAGGGGAPTVVGVDNCEVPLPAKRGDDVDARSEATTFSMAERQAARRRRSLRGLGSRAGSVYAGGGGESREADDGGRRGRRRSGRMTAAAEKGDTTTTMAADWGRKSG